MSELKTIEHYLSNPDDLSGLTDEQLEALAETPEEKSEEPTEEATEEAEVKAAEDTEEETEDAPEGVLSKDGKHVIPYWRLADAEARAREAADKAEQLEQQLAERLKGQDSDNQDELPEINADEIESQLEDFPELKQAFHATNARIEQLTAALTALNSRSQQLEAEQQARAQNDQQVVQQDIDAAIAATPKLAYLQRTGEDGQMADPAAWDRSVKIDEMLRGQPEWEGRPFADRFAKVVDVYEALYGPIQTSQEQPAPKKDADTKPAVPTSMSAIPGGTAPSVDEVADVLEKSGSELVSRYMNMTSEQIEAELNRL